MTPSQLKSTRHSLGMSLGEFGRLTRVHPRHVRRWEDGSRAVPGSVEQLLKTIDLLREMPNVREWLLTELMSGEAIDD